MYVKCPVYLGKLGVDVGYAVPLALVERIVYRCDNSPASFKTGYLLGLNCRPQVRVLEACLQYLLLPEQVVCLHYEVIAFPDFPKQFPVEFPPAPKSGYNWDYLQKYV